MDDRSAHVARRGAPTKLARQLARRRLAEAEGAFQPFVRLEGMSVRAICAEMTAAEIEAVMAALDGLRILGRALALAATLRATLPVLRMREGAHDG